VNYREIYQPLVSRSIENYQIQYLARKYDFGKESRIAHLLVIRINQALIEAEKLVGITRVLPFELYVKKHRCKIRLPLFKAEYLEPIYQGKTFKASRKLIRRECLQVLRRFFPKITEEKMLTIIDPWALARRKGPTLYRDELQTDTTTYDERDTASWHQIIDQINPQLPTERMETPDISAPEKLVKELTTMVSYETGLGKTVARHLVEEVITLRNLCCPRTDSLKSGEMPLLVTHVRAHLSEEIATRFRRLAPVIITVWKPEEAKKIPQNVPESLSLLKKRIIRVCFEAYRQNGLLTLMELQWIFQISSTRVSELIRSFQNEHNIIVPTPGTVLDAGRSMTHKDIIVKLHLEGYSVREIARITHHSPRAVDNYVGTFEAVLILYLYGLPAQLMARLLQKGISLINEYLKLIEACYQDEREIRNYLITQGVKF
jgi:hypothetical protein